MKKARAWLNDNGHAHQFYDFKKLGVPQQIDDWLRALGWQKLLNREGTSWRKLPPEMQAQGLDEAGARALMLTQPSLVKRPVVEWGVSVTVGFDQQAWAKYVVRPRR